MFILRWVLRVQSQSHRHKMLFTLHNQRKPGGILFPMPGEDLPLYDEQRTGWEGKWIKLKVRRRRRREPRKRKKELKKLRSSNPSQILVGPWERVVTTVMALMLFWTVVDPPSPLVK